MHTKRCSTCGTIKPTAEFYRRTDGGAKDGFLSACRVCVIRRSRAYAVRHKDQRRKEQRRGSLRRRYGMTEQQHIDLYHDHATDTVRGLLCRRCNMLIGMVDTSKDLLYDALVYIGA